EAYDARGRINVPRQNAYDRYLVLVDKDVAEVEEADGNVAAHETLLSGARGSGATRACRIKTVGSIRRIGCVIRAQPALRCNLVPNAEVMNCFGRSPSRTREVGILISDGLRRKERFLNRRGIRDIRLGRTLRQDDGRLIARH